jgi:hypothetical protein
VAKEWTPADVYDVLADERVRSILLATNERTRPVQDLTKVCEGSQSAIYRRVSLLVDHELLAEETKVDADGHHYSVYHPNFENIDIRFDDDAIVLTINTLDGASSTHTVRWNRADEE